MCSNPTEIQPADRDGRDPDRLPMWVVRSETPQELIDQVWNKGRKNKYFKPPETEEESATYYERYAEWCQKWQEESV